MMVAAGSCAEIKPLHGFTVHQHRLSFSRIAPSKRTQPIFKQITNLLK